jgi:hypothetical protein
MASTLHRIRPDGSDDGWSDEPLPLGLGRKDHWPSRAPSSGRPRSRGPLRFLITFGIGVGATLAWQSYGDVAREMLASWSPVLHWVAPPAAPIVQVADQVIPVAPAAPSPDVQQLKSISLDLAAVRQSMDQLAAQNQQMAGAVAALQAAQQSILRKVSAPPPR